LFGGSADDGSSAGGNAPGASGGAPGGIGGGADSSHATMGGFLDRRMADAALGPPGGAPEPSLARARTPYHSASQGWARHRFPQAPGRARTPWHDTHPGISAGGTGEYAGGTSGAHFDQRRGPVAAAVADEWRKAGMSEAGIAGIMANITHESAWKTGALEQNPTGAAKRLGGGHGLYQFTGPGEWSGPTGYLAWLKKNYPKASWTDPRLQSRFVIHQIKSGHSGPGLWNRINQGNAGQAAIQFVRGYLRPRADLRRHREAQYARGVPPVSHYTGGATAGAEVGGATGGRGGGFGAGAGAAAAAGDAAAGAAGGASVGGRRQRMPGASLAHVDPRLQEIMEAAATHMPPGYHVRATSGYRPHQSYGFHPKGMAADYQIIGPRGAIPNRGGDPTGMYTRLARAAKGEQQSRYPELTGRFAWGGAFGTVPGGRTSDLMHFDIGGERGHIRERMLRNMTALPGERYGRRGE
jgi:hypothetical protein